MDNKTCTHCGACRANCRFLEKYGIDIGDLAEREDLLYHCFLCGECTAVCPEGIDGRQMVLDMRRRQVKENGNKIKISGYEMLIKEKENYLFKNYKNGRKKSVLFTGCNFPSFYPETTRYLVQRFRREGIGVIYDCCGKPIAELGMEQSEKTIIERLNGKLKEAGVEEVIMLCPNCYMFLKPYLKIRMVSIYEKLQELGWGNVLEEDVTIFPPCPDRESREILEGIRPFLKGKVEIVDDVQCCGLGGCASRNEPEIVNEMVEEIKRHGKVYTYCASCSGNFARKGYRESEHLLLKILEREEKPDTVKSVVNRMKFGIL